MLWLSSAENLCDAKHGWCIPTHNALCHGLALKCQLGNCDKWCLEWPGTGGVWLLRHVKVKRSLKKKENMEMLTHWQYDMTPVHPKPGYISRWAQLSSIFTHAPDTLSLQSAVNKAGSAAWAYDHQWQLEGNCDTWTQSNCFFYCLKQSWHSRSVEMNKCVWKTNSHHIQPQDPWHLWCIAATNVNAFSLLFVQEPTGCWLWWGCKPE